MIRMKDIKNQLDKLKTQYDTLSELLDRAIKLKKKLYLDETDEEIKKEYLTQLKELLNEAQMLPLGDQYRKLIGDRLVLDFYEDHNDIFNAYMAAMLGEHFEIARTFEAVVCNNDVALMRQTVEKIINETLAPQARQEPLKR